MRHFMETIMLQRILEVKDRNLALAEEGLQAKAAVVGEVVGEAVAEAGASPKGKRLSDLALE